MASDDHLPDQLWPDGGGVLEVRRRPRTPAQRAGGDTRVMEWYEALALLLGSIVVLMGVGMPVDTHEHHDRPEEQRERFVPLHHSCIPACPLCRSSGPTTNFENSTAIRPKLIGKVIVRSH